MTRVESGWSLVVAKIAGVTACVAVMGLAAANAAEPAATPRTFQVTASKYKFEPARIEVNEGDAVKLVLHSTDTTHGIEIGEFNVKAVIPKDGTPVTVEFVASKAGTFQFKCSHFCGMGHGRMKGEIVVKPRVS
jgi:cytochrome c oxidase subunit II